MKYTATEVQAFVTIMSLLIKEKTSFDIDDELTNGRPFAVTNTIIENIIDQNNLNYESAHKLMTEFEEVISEDYVLNSDNSGYWLS